MKISSNDLMLLKLLIIEDDPVQCTLLKEIFKDCQVEVVNSLRQFSQIEHLNDFDCALLDLQLPDGSGLELLSKFNNLMPVFILTASNDTPSILAAFHLGADDYIEKPPQPLELRARVQARVLKARLRSERMPSLEFGDIFLDHNLMNAADRRGKSLDLTPHEFRLLTCLITAKGRPLSRAQILDQVWPETAVNERTVDAHIARLRRKLLHTQVVIETLNQVGYRIKVALDKKLNEDLTTL